MPENVPDWVLSLLRLAKDLEHESDRAVVIIGVAMLDKSLGELLRRTTVPPPKEDEGQDRLFDPARPLGRLSAKIEMVYRMGLIDLPFRTALNRARKIRNAFAHDPEHLNFGDQSTRDGIKALRELIRAQSPDLFDLFEMCVTIMADDGEVTPRHLFATLVSLMRGRLEGAHRSRDRPTAPMRVLYGQTFPGMKEQLEKGVRLLRKNADARKARENPTEREG